MRSRKISIGRKLTGQHNLHPLSHSKDPFVQGKPESILRANHSRLRPSVSARALKSSRVVQFCRTSTSSWGQTQQPQIEQHLPVRKSITPVPSHRKNYQVVIVESGSGWCYHGAGHGVQGTQRGELRSNSSSFSSEAMFNISTGR